VAALNGHVEAPASKPTRSLGDITGKPELQQVVLAIGCNPLYEFPGAIASGALVASFSSFPDETAEAAQLVLPNHTALEAWHQSIKESESIVVKPAVMPLYQTRDTADVLLQLSAKLGKPAPEASWKALLDADAVAEKPHVAAPRPKTQWEPPVFQGTGEFHFQVYAGIALGTGDAANIPWLQELPDPLAQNVWGSALEMNPKTAARMNLAGGDSVTIEAPRGRATARIAINPSAAPNVVAMAAGQGHTALGRYAKNRGVNAFALIDPEHWAATRVNVRKA
jgi:anaerobic selenocysteine-containing dehydrogenase